MPAAVLRPNPLTIASCLLMGTIAHAQFDPPAGYYASATGTGGTLQNQLHNIIDAHTVRSFNDARSLLQQTDQDPNDPDSILLAYDGVSLDVSVINPFGSIPGWDSGQSWNREHTWPRARGIESGGADESDLHLLRPSTPSVNTLRDSRNFGGSFGLGSFQLIGSGGSAPFYPGDADAGLTARQQFYGEVRYDGSDSGTTNLRLVNGNPSIGGTTQGDLADLIEWHFAAPPDAFERGRNQSVFGIQGNRNPFIDHPEWVHSVFVDNANDTRLSLSGAAVGADGGSTLALDLGRVFVGGPGPDTQQVTLDKAGRDGVYFSATATGAATSSITGSLNAFRTSNFAGVNGREQVTVGLNASTSQAGLTTGEVRFDNLDITTGGGAGRGANDADDVVQLSFTTVDHAQPSFAAGLIDTELTIDFGQVDLGAPVAGIGFDLFNLEQTPGFTADLRLDGVGGSGDTGVLTTDLAAMTVGGGSSASFLASIDTSAVGDFGAEYTLSLLDEDLFGALAFELTLNLVGSVVAAGPPGDFNGDGSVDAADYVVLRGGDAAGGFDAFVANFGAGSGASLLGVGLSGAGLSSAGLSGVAVPEPAASAMALLAAAGLACVRRSAG